MNRTDRLLAMVLELQGRGRRRAEDLARTFDVSKRTVYRDITALCAAGVPVVSAPGQGYWLMEGYFLPPLQFTSEEATMLSLGASVMAQTFDAQTGLAARSAGRKISAVLPERLRQEVSYLEENIRFIVLEAPGGSGALLPTLRRAILEQKSVQFRYFKRFGHKNETQPSLRQANPHGLFHLAGTWMMSAYCCLRDDMRVFRLDRMEDVELLEQTFERRRNFKLERDDAEDSRTVTVRVRFTPEIARWVKESSSYFVTSMEDTVDGLWVMLKVRSIDEILQWILSWGSGVQVLEPQALRERLREEARAVLDNHAEP